MFPSLEAEKLEDFKWVKKRKDIRLYESFTYDGVCYSLYDCVYMHSKGEHAFYIGKLVGMWENADKSKQINVQWFFRPSEISYYLRDAEVRKNELFFASGRGVGLANINPLEAISGKCNVVCISTDSRNPKPSVEELCMADYVFYRTFDVDSCTISDQIGDAIGGLQVEFVFNRKESDKGLNLPKLDSNSKDDEKNVIACEETLKLTGKTPEQLKTLDLEENCNHIIEKRGPDGKQVLVKELSLLVETNRVSSLKKSAPGGSCSPGVNVYSDKDKVGDTIDKQSIVGAKSVGRDGLMSPLERVKGEERGKSARVSNELEDKPSKRAKLNDNVASSQERGRNCKQSTSLPVNDAVPLVTSAVSSNAKPESELVNYPTPGPAMDVKLDRKLCFSNEKLSSTSVASFNENPKSGDGGNAAGIENYAVSARNSNSLDKSPSKKIVFSYNGRSKLDNAKNSFGIGKDLSGVKNSRPCEERSSTSNIVSPSETSNSGYEESFDGLGKAAKLAKDSNALTKRVLKRNPTPRDDVGHEKGDVVLANVSCRMEERTPKKAKCNNYINIKKLEKIDASGTSYSLVASDDNITSMCSKNSDNLNEGSSKECHDKMGKLSDGNLSKSFVATSDKNKDVKAKGQTFEVTRRPICEQKPKWRRELPWEESLKSAYGDGRVVLLQNLDPEYTSAEVEDIIWHAFEEYVTARVVQRTASSSPHFGQVFVIFKTKKAAEKVVEELDGRCLMLSNKRPLVVCTEYEFHPQLPGRQNGFFGHLALDKVRRQEKMELKEAVSTSHFAQPNTIEFEMAMEWCLRQSGFSICWERLHEEQEEQLKNPVADLKYI